MSVYVYLSVCMSACLLRKVGADSFVRICGRVGISQEKRVHDELLAGEEGVTYFVFVIVVAGDVACWILFSFIVESKLYLLYIY